MPLVKWEGALLELQRGGGGMLRIESRCGSGSLPTARALQGGGRERGYNPCHPLEFPPTRNVYYGTPIAYSSPSPLQFYGVGLA